MYYLFLRKEKDIDDYKKKFYETRDSIRNGVTPVYNEMRSARTNLFESLPYNFLLGIFTIIGTIILSRIEINDIVKIGCVLILNNFLYTLCSYIFIRIKHSLRIKLCKRMGIEPIESNIAVMESLEYQTVE